MKVETLSHLVRLIRNSLEGCLRKIDNPPFARELPYVPREVMVTR